jgi:D-sedoheptulose 7-phosphate isomerase
MRNSGSAADSLHLAAEIGGRFRRERRGWASIALTTDTSILTAVGNDYRVRGDIRAPD